MKKFIQKLNCFCAVLMTVMSFAQSTLKKNAVDASGNPITTVQQGDNIKYVVEVTNTAAASPASTVNLRDTADPFQSYITGSVKVPNGWTSANPSAGQLSNKLMATWNPSTLPGSYGANMAPLYGANTFGGQVPVSVNSGINIAGSGDGFDPITFRFPNGNLAVATINHHVIGPSILCGEFATGGTNCLGNFSNNASVSSMNVSSSAITGFSWRWAITGNKIFYPILSTALTGGGISDNTPGIGCLDFSNNKLVKCYTGTTTRTEKSVTFFQSSGAGQAANETLFVGVINKAGKVCTVWANANNASPLARQNELRIGCVDPLTMDVVSEETIVVSPPSALLANSTVGISVNNSSFGAGESHNNVVEQLPGDNWAVSFRQNYRLATAPGTNITENAFICLKSNPGNAATTDCNGNPITHTGSVNVAKNTNGTNATTNVPGNYTGQGMGILPSLDATGTVNGVCLEFGNRQCYDTNGNIIPGKLAATSLVFPGNSSSYDVVGLGKPYLLTYTWSWPDTSYCFDWSTNAPCANATAFNANTAYGSKAFVEQGNMCLVTYGHNAVWNLFSIDKTATGGQFTSGGCILNYTPTQRFKITDPSANFCNPQTNVTQWTTVDLRRLPIQSGSVLNFYSSAGTLIATAPVPATTTANSATTVTIPATVDYALYPTLDIELDLNGVNTTSASNAELYTNYITNDGSKPQICYDVKISNCPTNKQSTNSATVSGGSTGTTTITNTNQYLVCNVIDSDGDGIGDDVDIDDDNDGILDTNENANCSTNVATTTNPNPTANTTASGVTIQYTETGTVNTITDPSVGFAGLNPSQGATITYDFSNPVNNLKMWYADLDNREYLKINYYDENNNRISNLVSYISNDVGTTKNISSDANFGLLIDPTNNAGGGSNAAQQYVEVTTAFKVKKVEVTFNATRADGTAYNSTAQTPDIYIKGLCFYGDTDGDGIPDYLDLDSDADGCSDAIEGGAAITPSQLVTAAGTVNGGSTNVNQNLCALTTCVNTSGLPQFTILPTGYSNTTGQTVGNSIDSYKNDCIDNDSDNIPDWQDLDDDNDGILDISECNSPSLSLNDLNLLSGSPGTSTAFVPGTMLIKTNALNYLGNQYDAIVKVISKNTGTGEFALSSSGSTLAIMNSVPNTNPYGEFSIEFVPTGTVLNTSTSYTPVTIPLLTIEFGDVDGSTQATLSEVVGYKTTSSPSVTVGSSLENLGFLSGGGPSPSYSYSYYRDKNVSLGTASGNDTTGSEAAKVYLKFSSYTSGTFVFGTTGSLNIAQPDRGAIISQKSEYACDSDGDGITDALDLDSDGDGCSDAIEGGANITSNQLMTAGGTLSGGSTTVNQNICTTCVNISGLPQFTTLPTGYSNTIGQSIGQSKDATNNDCIDSDGDVYPDWQDLDDDNDGILDVNEQRCYDLSTATFQSFSLGTVLQTPSAVTTTTTSNAVSPFSPNQTVNVNYGLGNGKTITGVNFTGGIALTAVTNLPASQVYFRRNLSSSVPANQIIWMESQGATATDALKILVSQPTSMESVFNSSYYNIGLDNPFVNTDATGNVSNMERIDVVYPSGYTVKNASTESIVVLERGMNQSVVVAPILSINNSNIPTSLGAPFTINTSDYSLLESGDYTILFKDTTNPQFRPQDNISQDLGYRYINFSTLGVSSGTKIYGYAVLPSDYNTANILDWNTYPANTNNSFGGADIGIISSIYTSCTSIDTDGDGIPDYLDLDSDNDGCLDAIEGDENVTTAQLVTASGTVTVGTGSTASNQNLGNTVNTNGVPTIVNSGGAADIGSDEGQGVGSSADATVNACFCYKPGITDAGNTYPTKHGITALGRAGADNGNWPMERQSAWTVLESKEKGFVVNRVSTTAGLANITNPVEGMMVYDEEADCLKIYTLKQGDSAMAWHCFTTPACPD